MYERKFYYIIYSKVKLFEKNSEKFITKIVYGLYLKILKSLL